MNKHTPGPWEAFSLGSFIGVAGKKSDIAYMRLKEITLNSARSSEEDEANAYLIAAAPDMLDSLNAMMTHMGMDEDEWNKVTFDQARAAIAKATGSTT